MEGKWLGIMGLLGPSRTERIIQQMGESYSRSFRIAALRGEATAIAPEEGFYLQLYCRHDFVDVRIEDGKIGDLCTICDYVTIASMWIYRGQVIEDRTIAGRIAGAMRRPFQAGKSRSISQGYFDS